SRRPRSPRFPSTPLFRSPERVGALVLADTRAQADTDDARRTREETARRVLAEGMEPIADVMLPKLLAPATRERRPDVVARVRERSEEHTSELQSLRQLVC